MFKIFEFRFEEAVKELKHHELRYNRITQFDRRSLISLPHAGIGIEGSTNGFLFLSKINTQPNALYICNPITRDYIQLPHPERSIHYYPTVVTYEFGILNVSFDLETEFFRTFSPPSPRLPESRRFLGVLVVLEDCLCLCDNTCDDETVVWMMKEDCWRKEFVINKLVNLASPFYEVVYPLKVFRDVDALMRWGDYYLFYCFGENRTATEISTIELPGPGHIEAMLHTSSFVSLKCFGVKNVS
ncbi:hypothetical protein BUALT_Bualt07G0084800 [Buddleja alternifolia]|uniref:F-box associated domain-containing protein n=1 Tax=Buddleja alternifolia TaxID=168488 RepID=A0AAV6XG52_9LAMI|nr:hypothetical protein BUALT_Bualt07G0084800 [Buddleja alternifolia]